MKCSAFIAFVGFVFLGSCTNGEADNKNIDTANMLHDTFPATHNSPVAIPLDSSAPDATYVDSLNNMSR